MGIKTILRIFFALMFACAVATHVFAWQAWGHPALGLPLTRVFVVSLYAPHKIGVWAWQWGRLAPGAFRWAGLAAGMILLLGLVPHAPRQPDPPGQARWATKQDLRRAQCLGKTGLVLGRRWGRFLRYHGDGHLLLIASTGRGKSVLLKAMLLDYPHSVLVHDPKRELYDGAGGKDRGTAGWRSQMSQVVLLAPMDPRTHGYDPLQAVPLGTEGEVRAAQLIAQYLSNPDGRVASDDVTQYFQRRTAAFLTGAILYGLRSGMAPTLPEIYRLATQTTWEDLLKVWRHDAHPTVAETGEIMSRVVDRELGSLQSWIAESLAIFGEPSVAQMVSRNDVPLHALRGATDPMSLYVHVPFAHQARLRPLTRLIFRQLLDHAVSDLDGWQAGQLHPLLCVIDELPSLKRLEVFNDGLDYVRGYGVQLLLATPSMEALQGVYGPHHNFYAGCRVQVVFGLNDPATAEHYARRVGQREVRRQRVTTQPRGGKSTSEDATREDLLSRTALLRLPERSVLLVVGDQTCLADQVRHYEYRRWARRSQIPVPERKDAVCLDSSVSASSAA